MSMLVASGCGSASSVDTDASSVDAAMEDGGSLRDGGSARPGCAEPTHGTVGDDWPEVFLGVENCDDEGPGSRLEPFCSFGRAMIAAPSAGYIVTVLDGTYRLMSQPSEFRGGLSLVRAGSADTYFVLRADEGATPVILGSIPIAGADFEDLGDGLYRADARVLKNDPKGMWTAEGTRVDHQLGSGPGPRSHADRADLTEPGTWTKADASGIGCGGDNAGCFVYIRPALGTNMDTIIFELTQRGLGYFGASDYFVLRGLTINYTQPQAFFFEGADHLLIEDNSVGYTANGNDNSYSMRLWNTNGTIVRRNRVHDSRYWGGAVNSHGITFMLSGNTETNWVCDNEVFDIDGNAISSKGGSSNLNVVGNYVRDSMIGVLVPESRRTGPMRATVMMSGNYTIRENVFENCDVGVKFLRGLDMQEWLSASRIYNNTFVGCETGIKPSFDHPRPLVRNNIFQGGTVALELYTGNQSEYTTGWWLSHGLDSDYNLFDGPLVLRNQALDEDLNLADYRASYSGEGASLEQDAQLGPGPNYQPLDGSPALRAGDPSVYTDLDTVSIGHLPLAE